VDYEMQTTEREGTPVSRNQATDWVWLEVKVSNPSLQDFETDEIVVFTDRRGNTRTDTQNAHTNYSVSTEQISSTGTRVKVVGTGRNMSTPLPVQDLFLQAPSLVQDPNNPNRMFIKLEIQPKYFQVLGNPELQFAVTYDARQTSGPNSRQWEQFPQNTSRTELVSKNSRYIEVQVWGAGRNRVLKTDVQIAVRNSKWYSSSPVSVGSLTLKVN
ncbi:MAG: hypothetical protein K2X47_13015, partial [Bdellovibrionales bacterium]|nr:hypothetical protein [Bdellovibrionales bacterium]